MNLVQMPERQRLQLRKKCLSSLYCFCVAVMGYDDITDHLHGAYCRFLEKEGTRKQTTMPRSFVKTWIGSIAYPVWITLHREEPDEYPEGVDPSDKFYNLGTNMRVLIASYVISNSEKFISLIRKTYESNVSMQILFPEVIPHNFNKVRWSNQSACINRSENFTESTFEAAGIGGASTSRHYDLVVEDDLIYAKKDDFTGRELQPSQEDIDKAIGWLKLGTSLLVPGKHTHIHNAGTRWAKHDLVDYIWENEPQYTTFVRGAVDLGELEGGKPWRECTPEWNECYDIEQLDMIARAQGPYMFSTQYLLKPVAPEDLLFKPEWLQIYTSKDEVPKTIRIFTTVDVSEWSAPSRKSDCRSVILTCGWCDKHHMWVLHYDVGRYNPSEIIYIMGRHWTLFKPEAIGVEDVYYQKALAHFAREYMNEGKVPRMTLRALKPEGNVSKEIRIRGLEPLASNLAIHCRKEHKEFIEEYSEYTPNSKLCKKDILDATAYQMQIARPGKPISIVPSRSNIGDYVHETKMDDVLEKMFKKRRNANRFGNVGVIDEPYVQTHVPVFNPFTDGIEGEDGGWS